MIVDAHENRDVPNKGFWIENVPVGVRNAADSMQYWAMSQDFFESNLLTHVS